MGRIFLFGSGYMAGEYCKVLKSLGREVTLISRSEEHAKALAGQYGFSGYGGGAEALESLKPSPADYAIIATSVESLTEVTLACLKHGLKRLLVEKPCSLDLAGLERIKASAGNASVRIAYNRRFYNSVLALKSRLSAEKPLGCLFDFTELEKYFFDPAKPKQVLERFGLANSIHVIDAAFFLIGFPVSMQSAQSESRAYHPAGTVFAGSGRTSLCAFSYLATWSGGGRWNIEISTEAGRYKLCPLEELHFCRKNQFAAEKIDATDSDDKDFKPGVMKMVKAFLNSDYTLIPSIDQQISLTEAVNKICGYDP